MGKNLHGRPAAPPIVLDGLCFSVEEAHGSLFRARNDAGIPPAVKARKGNALLFFSMKPDGSFDSASLHSGCPVIKGEKWSATKWIHSG